MNIIDTKSTENTKNGADFAEIQNTPAASHEFTLSASKKSKLKSAKLWVTIWAVAMVSFIVLADRTAFITIAQWLCGVPLAYIGANVAQKKIFADAEKSEGK